MTNDTTLDLPKEKNRMFASLRVRDFRCLWVSNLAASFGMQMQIVARGWLIYAMTSSPLALTWVMLSFMLPSVIFSLVGGVMADRYRKKPLIILAQICTTLATLILAIIIYNGDVGFWHFIYFGFINGTLMALSMPARSALIPEIVSKEELVNAMALQSATFNFARILGPALAGILIAIFSDGDTTSTYAVGIVFFMIAIMYLISILSTALLHYKGEPVEREIQKTPLDDVKEGFRYMIEDRLILGLIIMSFLPFTFGMVPVFLLPAFSKDILMGGPDDLGLLMTASGVGAFLGSMLLARLGDFRRKGRVLFGASILWGVSIGALAISTSMAFAMLACAFTGLFSALMSSLNMSLVQLAVTSEVRGRVMSILMMTFGLMPLGVMPISAIAENVGIDTAFLISALLLIVSMIVLDRVFPELRKIRQGHGQT